VTAVLSLARIDWEALPELEIVSWILAYLQKAKFETYFRGL